MKKIFALSLVFGAMAFGESWTGTIVDTGCKTKDLASHTKKCVMGCAKSGLGVVLSDGKFVKFDEAGNAKALEALKASTKETDLKAKVTGKLDGDMLKVEKVEVL
jgi:N-acetyl-beta-hexosaminidase